MFKPMCAMVAAAGLLSVSFDSNALVTETGGGGTGPDCSNAVASVGMIWPPNHSMVAETILDVGDDTEGTTVTITVNSIYQDEPVLTQGSGNTQPDGMGVGTPTAYVRAERAGPGTGRLYFISFTAVDSGGLSCSGTVQVQVPHDQGQGYIPIDTGNRYDSTMVMPD